MSFNKRLLLASVVFICQLSLYTTEQVFAEDKPEKTNGPKFVPGEEVRIDVDNEDIGGDHFVVYVPSDYTDEQEWPAIFVYHGMGGQPTTWPFRQITEGRGFIVIGMGYVQDVKGKITKGQYIDYLKRERKSAFEVKRYVSKYLRIDDKRLFLTGNSKGGWHSSAVLEISSRAWAGVVILAAGRSRNVNAITTIASRRALRGKPIYIGAGEKDENLASAKKAVSYYERLGAKVTFEEYKGAGHAFDHTKPKKLYSWLLANSTTDDSKSDQTGESKTAESTK